MRTSRIRAWSFPFLTLLIAGLLLPGPIATSQENGNGHGRRRGQGSNGTTSTTATTYGGRAIACNATVLGATTVVSDTGELPSGGGCLESSVVSTNVVGLLSANACHAATIGQGTYTRSEASLGSLALTVAGNTISATFAMARAQASCDANGNATASGCSEITALSVNGAAVAITGAVNQENVSFLGIRIIINEQIRVVDGECAEITVNALHIIFSSILGVQVADIAIGCARAEICCGGASGAHAEVRDFVTGGGYITGTPSGARGNFGVAGGIKNGDFWGHLNYIDHGTGMHVKHVTITGYDASGPTERRITGTCTINGQEGFFFSVFVADNGEPGTNDTFNLFLSTGYTAGGFLIGGNIQLHQ